MNLTDAQVDVILYNVGLWRKALALLYPRSSTSFITLPVRQGPSNAVEAVAIKRASISIMLDAVDEISKSLPKDLQRICRMKYEQRMTYRRIGKELGIGRSTVNQKVDLIRNYYRLLLPQLDRSFWEPLEKAIE